MLKEHRIGAVLLMSGQGLRFGGETPKQFLHLSGKPIYRVTLEVFLNCGFIDEIVLSCHPHWIEIVEKELRALPNVRCIAGGSTRQESSYKGLKGFQTPPAVVLIHDAVRPFVSTEILRQNAQLALSHGAVDTCIPSADTLIHSMDFEQIASIPERSQYLRGQTPQSFSYPLILEAHEKSTRKDASDDCRLALDLGYPVWIARGAETNLKITSELDLFIAEQLFRLSASKLPRSHSSLARKRYAVVGGSGGIGDAVCQALYSAGAKAIALSRTASNTLDLNDLHSVEKAFEKLGPIDGLINCAGLLMVKPLCDLTLPEIESLLHVNLSGLILCCQKAKVNKGGHIVNVASSSFTRGRKEMTVYSCAKAAVVNFTQGLAEERPDLRVHTVIPHRTRTKMRLDNFPKEDPSSLLEPQEVAKTIVDLLMDADSTGMLVEVRK
jgi:2-C-methyl-D-erythritol 4-phosphate cytidylyltransferase